jgi:hypothetical protein
MGQVEGLQENNIADSPRERQVRQALQVENGKELAEVIRTLGQMEATLEHILRKQESLKSRVSAIENKINYAAGGAAILILAFSFAWDLIKSVIRP